MFQYIWTFARKRTANFKLGQSAPLTQTCLPLEVDIYNAVVQARNDLQNQLSVTSNYIVHNKNVFNSVLSDVKSIWVDKWNLPIVSDRTILEKIEKVYTKGKNLLKIPLERRTKILEDQEGSDDSSLKTSKGKRKQKSQFPREDFLHSLFDICSCKCESREDCKCPKERKVPLREWEFLSDQRKDRNDQTFMIGHVDQTVTSKWKAGDKIKAAENEQVERK